MSGFRELGESLRRIADHSAGGRLALVQEGGYAPSYAAFCLHATLSGVLNVPTGIADPLAYMPDHSQGVADVLTLAGDTLAGYWPCFSR